MIIEIKEKPKFKVGDIVLSRELIENDNIQILHIVTKIRYRCFDSLPFLNNKFTGDACLCLISDYCKAPARYSITFDGSKSEIFKTENEICRSFYILKDFNNFSDYHHLELCEYQGTVSIFCKNGTFDYDKNISRFYGNIIIKNNED